MNNIDIDAECDKHMEQLTIVVLLFCMFMLAVTLLVSLRTRPHDVLEEVKATRISIEKKIADLKRATKELP